MLSLILACDDPYETADIFTAKLGWTLDFTTPPESGDPLAAGGLRDPPGVPRGARRVRPRARGLVGREADVEGDRIARGARRVHLLDPERGALPDGVDEPVLGAVGARLGGVAQHRLPERPDRRDVEGVDRDLQD